MTLNLKLTAQEMRPLILVTTKSTNVTWGYQITINRTIKYLRILRIYATR